MYTIDFTLSRRYRTPVIIIANPKNASGELLVALMDDEREWQRREAKLERLRADLHFPFFRLRPSHSFTLLQKLAVTQNLYFNEKRIVGDFFSRLKLEYLVEPGYVVHALLNNIALSDYDLILQGAPHIAIRGSHLYFIDPEVAWQDLAPFLDGPKSMQKKEYLAFKKEVRADSLIELDSQAQEEAPKQPTLQLVDGTCSFVKVAKEYEGPELTRAGFCKKELGTSNYYCPTDKSLAAIESLLKAGWKVLDAKGNEVVPLHTCSLTLDARYELMGCLSFGKKEARVQDVFAKLKRHERLLDLSDGTSGLLCFQGHQEVQELLSEVELVSGTLTLPKRGLYCLQESPLIQMPERKTMQPASGFCGTLRPYQIEGLSWLISLYERGLNGLLADEMGLGKTVQVLAFLSHITAKTLIVVPTSLLDNWKREITQFLPHKTKSIYHGCDRELDTSEIIITSYGTLRSDIAHFTKHAFDCVILDEAQAVKNSSTITYQAIRQLNARFRLSLTGTPVENSLSELVSHFSFIEPGLIDADMPISQMRKAVSPFLLRRKKSDVAQDLPEKIQEAVFVTPTPEQKLLYDRVLAHFKSGLLKKSNLSRMEVFEALLRLRQIACHPALVPQLVEAFAPECTSSAKFDLVMQDVETLLSEGKKVVVFSQFTSMLHLLAKDAQAKGYRYLVLEGATKDRQALVDTFQNDPNYPLFFISLKAGGVGLNLTAADYVLLYDPWWNRAQEEQAVDRAHRIGRKAAVFSKRYYVEGTIEEKILALQEKKSKLSNALFDEGDVSLEDLQELLQ